MCILYILYINYVIQLINRWLFDYKYYVVTMVIINIINSVYTTLSTPTAIFTLFCL